VASGAERQVLFGVRLEGLVQDGHQPQRGTRYESAAEPQRSNQDAKPAARPRGRGKNRVKPSQTSHAAHHAIVTGMTADGESNLREALASLPEGTRQLLAHHRFDQELLLSLVQRMQRGELSNHLTGVIEPPTGEDVIDPPAPGTSAHAALVARGEEALRSGQCALVVLAGGMATRMQGVVKALVEALPGRTFLDLRLAEQQHLGRKYGAVPPLWLMTSHATQAGIEAALGSVQDGVNVATFTQGLSVRVTADGQIFREEDGSPSLHAPGHGDLPDALAHSGLLRRFASAGGRYVLVTNLDNLGGGLDPLLIGLHLERGRPVTCEVVDKLGSDRGGIPARVDGRPVVLEEFRIPSTFDPNSVRVFSVNNFAFDADALDSLRFPWTYFCVEKTAHGKKAIQFERLINEVTFQRDTTYVRVPRTGPEARFLPVKDHAELEVRRPEISLIAQARGMLGK
jgi:UTP--glucose-1-phosphate uridylyltransferase